MNGKKTKKLQVVSYRHESTYNFPLRHLQSTISTITSALISIRWGYSISASSRVDAASKVASSAVAKDAARHYGPWWLVTTEGTGHTGWVTEIQDRPVLLVATRLQLIADYTRVIEKHSSPIRHTFTSLLTVFRKQLAEAQPLHASYFLSHTGRIRTLTTAAVWARI